MCLDYAARIVERDGDAVVIESEGRRRKASTLLVPEARVGDWVYVAAGTVIELLDPEEAVVANQMLRYAQGALT